MQHLINHIPAFTVVMSHPLEHGEYAVLLAANARFAACKTRPASKLVTSPNYAGMGHGLLSAPLSEGGLNDMLNWTERPVALRRFKELAGLPLTANGLSLVPSEP